MAGKRRGRYTPEVRERIEELARSGRSPASLACEFEPVGQTIRNWVRPMGRYGVTVLLLTVIVFPGTFGLVLSPVFTACSWIAGLATG